MARRPVPAWPSGEPPGRAPAERHREDVRVGGDGLHRVDDTGEEEGAPVAAHRQVTCVAALERRDIVVARGQVERGSAGEWHREDVGAQPLAPAAPVAKEEPGREARLAVRLLRAGGPAGQDGAAGGGDVASHEERLPVGGPEELVHLRGELRRLQRLAALERDEPRLRGARARRDEGDAPPVGGEARRAHLLAWRGGEPARLPTGARDDPQRRVELRAIGGGPRHREGDELPVRRERGRGHARHRQQVVDAEGLLRGRGRGEEGEGGEERGGHRGDLLAPRAKKEEGAEHVVLAPLSRTSPRFVGRGSVHYAGSASTFTLALPTTSRWGFTGTSWSPTVLMGSLRSMVRRSRVRPRAASASTMSMTVTDP